MQPIQRARLLLQGLCFGSQQIGRSPCRRHTKKPEQLTFANMAWTGEVPPQKWMKFYTAVLSKFAAAKGLKLKLTVEVVPEGGISKQKVEATKGALRELGMNDDLTPT